MLILSVPPLICSVVPEPNLTVPALCHNFGAVSVSDPVRKSKITLLPVSDEAYTNASRAKFAVPKPKSSEVSIPIKSPVPSSSSDAVPNFLIEVSSLASALGVRVLPVSSAVVNCPSPFPVRYM